MPRKISRSFQQKGMRKSFRQKEPAAGLIKLQEQEEHIAKVKHKPQLHRIGLH